MNGTMSIKVYEDEKGNTHFEAETRFVDVSEIDKINFIANIMKSLKIDPYMVAVCAPIIEEMNKKSEATLIDLEAMDMYKEHKKDEGGSKA